MQAAAMSNEPMHGVVNSSKTLPPARILVVDDQDDVRRMLVTALEMEGHVVDESATAREGLKHLQESEYDLVLSDYAMPGGTGAWMLHEATRRGLMERAVAMIITAHPDVRDLSNVEVITKPFDLDHFLDQVRRLLERARKDCSRPSESRQRTDAAHAAAQHRVELVLYISSTSAASLQALEHLDRLMTRFNGSQVKLTVHDLVRDPAAGEQDDIAFTPTLVKRYPEPRMWVLGNLRDPEILEDLLRVCGVDESQSAD
jgi:DNA-binding response OmpR family regulator